MKVIMSSFMTGGPVELKPNDPFICDDAEGERLIGLGAARAQTAEEVAAEAKAKAESEAAAKAAAAAKAK